MIPDKPPAVKQSRAEALVTAASSRKSQASSCGQRMEHMDKLKLKHKPGAGAARVLLSVNVEADYVA